MGDFLDWLQVREGAIDRVAVAHVAQGDVDCWALFARMAFLEIHDLVDVGLVADQHAALERNIHRKHSEMRSAAYIIPAAHWVPKGPGVEAGDD